MRLPFSGWLAMALAAPLVGAALYFLGPRLLPSSALERERERSGLVERHVELAGGHRVSYLEGGRGETLVLLHGSGADMDQFTAMARFLVGHYRVVVPDLVGLGDSPADRIERLGAWCAALGIERPHVGGSGTGARTALAWSASRPEWVQSLWLLEPSNLRSVAEIESAAAAETRIAGLKTAALVVFGSQAQPVAADASPRLRRLLPRAHVVVMPDAGALPATEQPQRAASDYLRFRDSM